MLAFTPAALPAAEGPGATSPTVLLVGAPGTPAAAPFFGVDLHLPAASASASAAAAGPRSLVSFASVRALLLALLCEVCCGDALAGSALLLHMVSRTEPDSAAEVRRGKLALGLARVDAGFAPLVAALPAVLGAASPSVAAALAPVAPGADPAAAAAVPANPAVGETPQDAALAASSRELRRSLEALFLALLPKSLALDLTVEGLNGRRWAPVKDHVSS